MTNPTPTPAMPDSSPPDFPRVLIGDDGSVLVQHRFDAAQQVWKLLWPGDAFLKAVDLPRIVYHVITTECLEGAMFVPPLWEASPTQVWSYCNIDTPDDTPEAGDGAGYSQWRK